MQRNISNWTGLLKWSLQYQDGTNTQTPRQMSEEDRKFLQDAFKSVMVDEVERMRYIVNVLKLPDDNIKQLRATLQEKQATFPFLKELKLDEIDDNILIDMCLQEKQKGLEELDDRVGLIDNAIDFFKIGGYEPLFATLASRCHPHPNLQWRAAQVLSTLVQNNPKCQESAMQMNIFSVLFAIISPSRHPVADSDEEKVIIKSLLAIAGMVRLNTEAEKEFNNRKGVELLIRFLSTPSAGFTLIKKSTNLLHFFLSTSASHKEQALRANVIHTIVPFIVHNDIDLREAALKLLVLLCEFQPEKEKERQQSNNSGKRKKGKKKKKKNDGEKKESKGESKTSSSSLPNPITVCKLPELKLEQLLKLRFEAIGEMKNDEILGVQNELELLRKLSRMTFPNLATKYDHLQVKLSVLLLKEQEELEKERKKQKKTNLYQEGKHTNSDTALPSLPLGLPSPPSSSPPSQ